MKRAAGAPPSAPPASDRRSPSLRASSPNTIWAKVTRTKAATVAVADCSGRGHSGDHRALRSAGVPAKGNEKPVTKLVTVMPTGAGQIGGVLFKPRSRTAARRSPASSATRTWFGRPSGMRIHGYRQRIGDDQDDDDGEQDHAINTPRPSSPGKPQNHVTPRVVVLRAPTSAESPRAENQGARAVIRHHERRDHPSSQAFDAKSTGKQRGYPRARGGNKSNSTQDRRGVLARNIENERAQDSLGSGGTPPRPRGSRQFQCTPGTSQPASATRRRPLPLDG